MHALADVARGLGEGGLGMYLYLGRGEEMTGGRDKDSILADGLESLFGAVFLSHGLETSQRIILRLFDERIEKAGATRRRTGLEDLAAGAELRARLRPAAVPDLVHRPGPQQGVHRDRDGRGGEPGRGRRTHQERGRAAGGCARVDGAHRTRRLLLVTPAVHA